MSAPEAPRPPTRSAQRVVDATLSLALTNVALPYAVARGYANTTGWAALGAFLGLTLGVGVGLVALGGALTWRRPGATQAGAGGFLAINLVFLWAVLAGGCSERYQRALAMPHAALERADQLDLVHPPGFVTLRHAEVDVERQVHTEELRGNESSAMYWVAPLKPPSCCVFAASTADTGLVATPGGLSGRVRRLNDMDRRDYWAEAHRWAQSRTGLPPGPDVVLIEPVNATYPRWLARQRTWNLLGLVLAHLLSALGALGFAASVRDPAD